MENHEFKILWNFILQRDYEIYGKKLEIIVVQKDKNLCQIIDFACHDDGRVDRKNLKKIGHYQDLAQELRKT